MRRSTLLAVLFSVFEISMWADKTGSQPPPLVCPICGCATECVSPQMQAGTSSGASLSLTEGNLSETADLSSIANSTGPTLAFTARYDSYNADASHAQVDTTMGYGWTHSYN